VSDDGHSLKIYFYYVSLNLPKIFSKIIVFVFFISIFYVINKYNNSNELLVFWNNGIKKIKFINFILVFSLLFLIIQLALNLFIVPKSQNLGRLYIKESNIDFLPKLISEKKFINVMKNLTIFVEEYKKNGKLKKIYINENIDSSKSKIIVAENGRIIKKDNKYILRLFNGGITNINKDNAFTLNFSETDYDSSEFSTKTITHTKVQELDSIQMFLCLKEIFQNKKFNKDETINKPESETCNDRTVKSLSEELYKRSVLPFYTLIISLIASSLVIEPRSKYFMKFHKLNLFLIGISVIILSQLSLKFFLNSMDILYLILFLPIILVILYYILLLIFTKFKLNYL
jgi:lipopolysaccharide export system permease protein